MSIRQGEQKFSHYNHKYMFLHVKTQFKFSHPIFLSQSFQSIQIKYDFSLFIFNFSNQTSYKQTTDTDFTSRHFKLWTYFWILNKSFFNNIKINVWLMTEKSR